MKVKIVGCGLAGATAAVILREKGHKVEIFETRPHVAGNCYDTTINGLLVHMYGPHIFHTPHKVIWDFVNRFTKFNRYIHRVLANTSLGQISIPYSKLTEFQLGKSLSDDRIKELIFVDYTEKQWGLPWEQVSKSILNRVPTRRNDYDDRYFTDSYQGIPIHGYTQMVLNMLEDTPVHIGVSKDEWTKHQADLTIYTGKIDDFFDDTYGSLPYRSLIFEHMPGKRLNAACVNECNKLPYTRTTDHAFFYDFQTQDTILTKEYPCLHDNDNVPCYPMAFGEGAEIYLKYKQLADSMGDVIFLGRLATYKYLDMHMVIQQVIQKLGSL